MIDRVTTRSTYAANLEAIQGNSARVAQARDEIISGRAIRQASENPGEASHALRTRTALAESQRFERSAQDGIERLGQADTALQTISSILIRAREIATSAANPTKLSGSGAESLAIEIDSLRASALSAANTTYLGRPVFGGVVNGAAAYDENGSFVGEPGSLPRPVGPGQSVDVALDGTEIFGPDGASVFDILDSLATAIRSRDVDSIIAAGSEVAGSHQDVATSLAGVGRKVVTLEAAQTKAVEQLDRLDLQRATVEDTDLAKATLDLKSFEVTYQASLAAIARVEQISLLNFLR